MFWQVHDKRRRQGHGASRALKRPQSALGRVLLRPFASKYPPPLCASNAVKGLLRVSGAVSDETASVWRFPVEDRALSEVRGGSGLHFHGFRLCWDAVGVPDDVQTNKKG